MCWLVVVVVFVSVVLLAIAIASVTSIALLTIGGILLAIGPLLLLVCLYLCEPPCCCSSVRDTETQTVETVVVGANEVDSRWHPGWLTTEKKIPSGVLRDGRPSDILTQKHVTISPRTRDSSSNEYSKGGKVPTVHKAGPGSVSKDMSTLTSFAYLRDPPSCPQYGSLSHRDQHQQNVHQVPIHVIHVQRGGYADQEHVVRSNVLPARRHSDDDHNDNSEEVVGMLPQQIFQPHWQHQFTPCHHYQPQNSNYLQWQHTCIQMVCQYQQPINLLDAKLIRPR